MAEYLKKIKAFYSGNSTENDKYKVLLEKFKTF
jgi:hypothetical protein